MQNYFFVFLTMAALAASLWYARSRLAASRREKRLSKAPREGARYQEIFEHSADAIFVIEVLGAGVFRFESLNPVAMEALDPAENGLAGCRLDELDSGNGNHQRQLILQELSAHLVRAVETGLSKQYEGAFSVAVDGKPVIHDITLFPMVDDGGISHFLCFARDISANKLYESELLKRAALEERLSGFAASAPGFFYSYLHSVDGGNSMPFASEGINQLFGLRPEDVAQSIAPLSLCLHVDDMSRFIQSTADSAAGLSPLAIEFRVHHSTKGELWVESRAMPVLNPDGSIVWHGFMHDITERKRAEEALRASEEKLRDLYELSPLGIVLTDMNGRYIEFNEAFSDICGYPADELGSLDYWTLTPREYETREAEQLASLSDSGYYGPYEKEYMRKDGTRIPIELHGTLVTGKDGERYIWSIVEDISERKRMEAELMDSRNFFNSIIDAIPDPIFVKDREHRWILLNDACCSLIEFSREALIGKPDYDFLPTKRSEELWARDERIFTSGATSLDEDEIAGENGELRYIQTKKTPLVAENGQALLIGVIRDISGIKLAEHQLQETQEKLRKLVISREMLREDERTRISHEMHEELGQLLAAMKMRLGSLQAQLPQNDPLPHENVRAVIGLLDSSIGTVHEIVSAVRPTVLSYGPVVALEWLTAEFGKLPGIQCELEVDEEEGSSVSGELTTQIFRVAQEFLENVALRTGPSSIALCWQSRRDEHCLTVYYHGDNATDISGDSSLSFFGMQERVKAFGGEMRVFSSPECSLVIEVFIPSGISLP